MLEFLNEVFNEEDINYIKSNIYPSLEFDLNSNDEDCIKIIKYFKELGLNNIPDLVVNYSFIFLKDFDIVKDKFSKLSFEDINKINYDFSLIEDIVY